MAQAPWLREGWPRGVCRQEEDGLPRGTGTDVRTWASLPVRRQVGQDAHREACAGSRSAACLLGGLPAAGTGVTHRAPGSSLGLAPTQIR